MINFDTSANRLVITICFLLFGISLYAQSGVVTIPYTNGEVKALANYGDTVFVGGQFSKVYSYEQSSKTIAYFDTLSGQHIAIKVNTNGAVNKIIRDENGTGFYIGGTFTTIGDSARSGVAHIDASGNVTARLRAWKIAVPDFRDLALRGDSLFAAGSYLNNIAPVTAAADSYLKGISTLTAVNDNATLPNVNGEITYMVVDGMGARYICGSFTQVGNQSRNRLAKIDSLGNVLPWEPNVSGVEVSTLMLKGNTILLGGRFEFVNGLYRRSFAEVDTVSGKNTTSLFVDANRSGNICSVYSIDKWQNTLIVSGDFTHIGDSARAGVAVIDTATGRATSRLVNIDGAAYKISVSGNMLYLGGSFATVNGISRPDIASINLSTGALSTLTVSASALSGIDYTVNDLVLNGTTLYLGLLTFPINSVLPTVAGVVAINTSTNAIITQFSVPRDQQVMRLVLHQGVLYASGNFTQMAGNNRSGLASITVSTNTLTGSFANNTLVNERVLGGSNNRLLLSASSTDQYVQFNNNQRSTGLLVYHTTSDSMFIFPHQIIGQVNSVLISNDTLFMGGFFTLYGRNRGADSTRNNLAAVRLSTYDVLAPGLNGVSGTINTLVKWNNTIIAGGSFSGQPSGLVGVDIATSSLIVYGRSHSGTVNQMCLIGNQLYLAGSFSVSGNPIGLISTSAFSFGSSTTWSTDYNFCKAISVYQNKLYVYGTYGNQLKEIRTYTVPFNPVVAPTLLANRSISVPRGEVNSFESFGNRIIAAGSFEFVGSEITTNHLFAYQRSTGKVILQNLSLNADALVTSIARFGQTLYIGGFFDSINGIARTSIAAVDLSTGTVNAWNPGSASTWIHALHITDSNLWVGGGFSAIAGQPRNGLAVFNVNTQTLRSGVPQLNANAQVVFIKSNAGNVFIGGGFDSVGGVYINRLASFNRASLALNTNWKPYLYNSIGGGFTQMEVVMNNVYVMRPNNQLLKIHTLTGLPDSAWSKPLFPIDYKNIIPYRTGLLLLGGSSYLIDTVQGNQIPVVLSQSGISSVNPFQARINTGILLGDTIIFGGWFTDNTRNHILESNLTGNELLRMETSQLNVCKNRNFTIRLVGADTLIPRTYVARLSGSYIGLITVPTSMSVTFKLPSTYASGSYYTLTLESQTTKLEVSRTLIVGDPPVKTIQSSGLLQLCTGQSTTLFYTDSTDRAVNSYKWFRNDTLIPGANSYLYSNITAAGLYRSIIETPANCIDTTATIAITATGLCQAPNISSKNLLFKEVSPNRVTLFWKKGNGSRRIVLAKLDTAVNATPVYGVTYYPIVEFGFGDSLGFRNYTVYNGEGSECSVTGLLAGRKYHFAVIEYNQTGAATSYQLGSYLVGSITTPSTTYYNKTSGNLNVLATWGTNTDGTGTAPVTFTAPAIYTIRNGTTPTLNGDWLLDSTNSVVTMGVGSSPTPLQLTIPSGITIACGNMNVNGNAILTVTGSLTTNFLQGSDTSLIVYNAASSQQLSPSAVGRFTAQGGSKLMAGDFWVKDTLRIDAVISATSSLNEDSFMLGTKFTPRGHLIRTTGFITAPFKRWIVNAVASGTNGLLPLGPSGRFIQLDITTPATGIGAVLVIGHFLSTPAGNSGLPLTENGVTVNTVGTNGYWKVLNPENRQGLVFNLIATAAGYTGVSQPSQTRLVTRLTGGNWQLFGPATTVSGSIASFTLTKTNVSAFGEFAVAGNTSVNPLPVQWISVKASWKGEDVTVNWQTASEDRNDRFEIERSVDGLLFETIGFVRGKGRVNQVSTYDFYDSKVGLVNRPVLYYRIKQIDSDGNFSYSSMVTPGSIEDVIPEVLLVYPNPSNGLIRLSGFIKEATIFDSMGKPVGHLNGSINHDMSSLDAGIYFIRSGEHTQKWIKY